MTATTFDGHPGPIEVVILVLPATDFDGSFVQPLAAQKLKEALYAKEQSKGSHQIHLYSRKAGEIWIFKTYFPARKTSPRQSH